MSGLPAAHFPNLSFWHVVTFDKFAHAFMYGVFTVLVAIGEIKCKRFSTKRSKVLITAFVVAMVSGVAVELLQAYVFFGRSADILDVFANTLGCLLGVAYFKLNFNIGLKPVRW